MSPPCPVQLPAPQTETAQFWYNQWCISMVQLKDMEATHLAQMGELKAQLAEAHQTIHDLEEDMDVSKR